MYKLKQKHTKHTTIYIMIQMESIIIIIIIIIITTMRVIKTLETP